MASDQLAKMVVKFGLLFYLTCLPCVLSLAVTDNIVRAITDQISDLSSSQITEKIEFHYKLLGLIDNKGRWVHRYFKKYSDGYPSFPR